MPLARVQWGVSLAPEGASVFPRLQTPLLHDIKMELMDQGGGGYPVNDIGLAIYAAAVAGIIGTICMFKKEPKLASACYALGICFLVLYLLWYFFPVERITQ